MVRSLFAFALLGAQALVNAAAEVETRTIDEIYQAALAEGGTVTLWHGGDESTQQNSLKASFEKKFPGMTLNVTVDLSKYHDGKIDEQIAANNYGTAWLDKLLALNPRWVRGTQTPRTIYTNNGTQWAATFTSSGSLNPVSPFKASFPVKGQFVSWPQTGGILKDAPHPEGAKLLHAYILSTEFQQARGGWSVRGDVPPPANYPAILDVPGTDPTAFGKWMSDRAAVERLRFWLESRLGTAQGLSPLIDSL
ncbi:ABC-type Fe3+ transport system [Colletotrichum tofieldiae]|nr:ABC-type Fe3+ transport system [Colletotrichum tofieldiae]